MQRSLLSFVLVALVFAAAVDAHEGRRNLRTLISKHVGAKQVGVQTTGSSSISLGHLTITKGAAAAPAPAAPEQKAQPAQQPAQAPAAAPAAEKKDAAPAAAAPAPAQTSAPAALPRGAPVAGTNDIGQALQCQNAFDAQGGRSGVESALGSVCQEGSSSFNALGCCQATAKLLNSGSLNRCACNNLVYQQLCQEVKVGGLNCESLRPTLVACGLQC